MSLHFDEPNLPQQKLPGFGIRLCQIGTGRPRISDGFPAAVGQWPTLVVPVVFAMVQIWMYRLVNQQENHMKTIGKWWFNGI